MLETDLAKLYGVDAKILNQAVKLNITWFSNVFKFQLIKEEKKVLNTNCGHLNE